MAEKIILKVVAETKGASKDIDKVGKGANTAAKETTFLSAAMGGVSKAMKMVRATSKMMFGSIKAGIISTGIGVLLIAFGALVSYFTNTKKGAEQLKVIFAGFGAVVAIITDVLSKAGEMLVGIFTNPKKAITSLMKMIKENVINRFMAVGDIAAAVGKILKAVFTLDFGAMKEGIAELGESMVQMTTGVDDAFNKATTALGDFADNVSEEVQASIRLEKEQQALTDATREFGLEKAKTRQAIEAARLAAEDESLTAEQRLEQLKAALVLEASTTEKELALQKRRVAAKEEEVAMSESTQEDLQALADEKIKLITLETASIKMKKKIIAEVNTFEAEIAAEEKARSDARRARGKARRKQRETEAAQLKTLLEQIELMEITNADDRAQRALEIQRESALAATKGKKNSAEQILAINEKYDLLEADRLQKIKDKKEADDTKDEDIAEAKRIEEADKLNEYRQNNTLNAITDAQDRAAAELKIAFDKEIALAELMENSEEVKAEIVKKYEKLKQESSEATLAIQQKNALESTAAVGSAIGQAAALTEKGSKKWKALKTAEALISTFIGAQRAYNSTVGIVPIGTVLAPIMAGLAVASGMAQVRSIQNTELPKMARGGIVGGYGSGTSDSVNAKLSKGEAVINARSASMFRGALSSMNLAGGGVGFAGEDEDSSGGGVIKAFVLSDEMTSKQARTEKINRRTSI